jgi:hypothetical protein
VGWVSARVVHCVRFRGRRYEKFGDQTCGRDDNWKSEKEVVGYYRLSLLSCPWTRQRYRVETLHSPGIFRTASVLRKAIKGALVLEVDCKEMWDWEVVISRSQSSPLLDFGIRGDKIACSAARELVQ